MFRHFACSCDASGVNCLLKQLPFEATATWAVAVVSEDDHRSVLCPPGSLNAPLFKARQMLAEKGRRGRFLLSQAAPEPSLRVPVTGGRSHFYQTLPEPIDHRLVFPSLPVPEIGC